MGNQLIRIRKGFALIIGVILIFGEVAYSQSYGLGFNGQEFSKDLRTGIDLSPKGYLSLANNFELVFKMQLRPNARMYFGYLVRVIDKSGKNVDLIFNHSNIDSSSIEVVCGQKQTKISLKADAGKFSTSWTEFRLKIDGQNNRVSLFSTANDFQAEDTGVNMTGEVKILFGMNDFSHYKTADLPSMKIKDISIYEKGKLSYSWPLDESEGNISRDKVHKSIANVKNPVWLKLEHSNWLKAYSGTLKGHCEIAFNEQEEKVYIIGEDQMIIYSVRSGASEIITYENRAKILLAGRQAIYNSEKKSVIVYDIDQKSFSEFDFGSRSWKQQDPKNTYATIFLHHNQYYWPHEKSLYVFGGYGQHEYRNLVQRLNLDSGDWKIVKAEGDLFKPRYLAASGCINDTVFILGGYGSESGKQILNPQNYNDLLAYSLRDQKFKVIYNYAPPSEDLCFSNSMVINRDNRTFYALAFSVIKYDGELQLVKGSLQKPELKLIAGKIPYLFHDVRSFSSLYDCNSSQKLVASTLLVNDQNLSEFNLYTIASPPNEQYLSMERPGYSFWSWYFFLGLGFAAFAIGIFLRKRFSRGSEGKEALANHRIVGTDALSPNMDTDLDEKEKCRNSVFFFGGLQVFNREGVDITNRFSPLLKELFLLIWLYSIKYDKGISSEKLTELLWFDKDEHSANNNRAVNIAKLKQILSDIDTCTLSHKTAYWKIEFDEKVLFNDYHECLKITNTKRVLSKEKIGMLMELSKKGTFLASANYQWLDDFKDNISNEIIDKMTAFAQSQKIEEDPAWMVHLADSLFIFDIVNEEAMILKCKALTLMGKHSLASHTFAKFTKDFKALYNQYYDKSLEEVINQDIDI
jgi:two-component SAPR family response regulator